MRKLLGAILVLIALVGMAVADEASVHCQKVSVMVKTDSGSGSGVLVKRDIPMKDGSVRPTTFIVTAAHVVDSERRVRTVIIKGQEFKIVEFDELGLVREEREDGRSVGESKMICKVIKYSDADNERDVAILMILKKNFGDASAEFYLDEALPEVGTDLVHCGSLRGQLGANSITKGPLSQIGRVLDEQVFDQTAVPAFPGSSGGGVWILSEKKGDIPKYIGMLTQGAGETFNFIVPIREMVKWGKEAGVEWLFNPAVKPPTWEDLRKLPVEGAGSGDEPIKQTAGENKPKGKNHFFLYKPSQCESCGQKVTYDGHPVDAPK